jgi:hypothetical protein
MDECKIGFLWYSRVTSPGSQSSCSLYFTLFKYVLLVLFCLAKAFHIGNVQSGCGVPGISRLLPM